MRPFCSSNTTSNEHATVPSSEISSSESEPYLSQWKRLRNHKHRIIPESKKKIADEHAGKTYANPSALITEVSNSSKANNSFANHGNYGSRLPQRHTTDGSLIPRDAWTVNDNLFGDAALDCMEHLHCYLFLLS